MLINRRKKLRLKNLMGALHWLESIKLASSASGLDHFEWEMKNFSSEFQLPNLENPPSQPEGGGGGRRRKDSKRGNSEAEEQEEEVARCEWNFSLATVVSSRSAGTVSDTIGSIEIDPTDRLVATGGIARKIRIYSLNKLLPNTASHDVRYLDHSGACDYFICAPAKLSSLRWRPGSGGRVIGCGDYDGVVTEYDLEGKIPVFERDEHGGRRVWSVDYSYSDPVLGASGADDGTMQMWDPRHQNDVAVVTPPGKRSVCSVEFNPFNHSMVAMGCADHKAYAYDIRKMSDPVMILEGHRRTVSYVRFLDSHTLVSAGTDGCLKMWDIKESRVIRTYRGHINSRSFVGLSVQQSSGGGGLLGCGSEKNEVVVYDTRWGQPIWARAFGTRERVQEAGAFVSSVHWRHAGAGGEENDCTLLSGGSDGVLQIFVGRRTTMATNGGNSLDTSIIQVVSPKKKQKQNSNGASFFLKPCLGK
ncbi:WD repeat-containing protein RUP2 [Neltuma alba]|uniref:WD repeat-containing protein RUP2 n=1 Tax=Neltuma alba TaxID=207710 RepID=UPI0010A3B7B6|nr:WD repeat-containing protein RUP2 [Prosopis alba]